MIESSLSILITACHSARGAKEKPTFNLPERSRISKELEIWPTISVAEFIVKQGIASY